MLKTKLLISLFAGCFMALTSSQLEARHNSHFNMQVNVGAPARSTYVVTRPAPVIVQSAPVYVQTPVVVETPVVQTAVVPTPVAIYPQYYSAPTYVVPVQPVVVTTKRARPTFNWGFNWGFSFR
jgi:hypothetical protein